MAVTIKQIAERSGLSVPTVSRILNKDTELFRPATRERVLKAARELGYRPNSYRMALRTKRFNAIGLLFAAGLDRGGIAWQILAALLPALHRRDQHLVAGQVPEGGLAAAAAADEASVPKMLREWSVDGMLILNAAAAAATTPEPLADLIEHNHIPAIWLNVRRDADCVYADDRAGAHEATERLLRLGHRRILFVDPNEAAGAAGHGDPAERRAGHEAAIRNAGLAPRALVANAASAQERLGRLSGWIREQRGRQDFPTAAFCASADNAVALFIAASQAGLWVPHDLSIVSIDDGAAVDALGLRISALRMPAEELALRGLEALDEKIADPSRPVPPRVLPLEFDEGATLAPPPAHGVAEAGTPRPQRE